MKRISSRATFFNKRVIPVIWFGFLAFFVVIALSAMIAKGKLQILFLLIPVLLIPAFIAVIGYVIMKLLVLDLVDEVWDSGDALIVKNKNQEELIPLSEIMNVSYSVLMNPPRVTLTLRRPSRFGKEVSFIPPFTGFMPFTKSPIINELIDRIDAKRRG